MEKIDQRLYEKNEVDIPFGVHQSIMARVNYLHFRPIFFLVLVIFIVNLLILFLHIDNKLIEAEFLDMVTDFTTDSYSGLLVLNILTGKFFEIISVELLASLFLNLIGTIYFSKKIVAYRFSFTTY